jgi:hypothetical protein
MDASASRTGKSRAGGEAARHTILDLASMSFAHLLAARVARNAHASSSYAETTEPPTVASLSLSEAEPSAASELVDRAGLYGALPAALEIRRIKRAGRGIWARDAVRRGMSRSSLRLPRHVDVMTPRDGRPRRTPARGCTLDALPQRVLLHVLRACDPRDGIKTLHPLPYHLLLLDGACTPRPVCASARSSPFVDMSDGRLGVAQTRVYLATGVGEGGPESRARGPARGGALLGARTLAATRSRRGP